MTDEELALASKAGERGAFEELARRHQGRVYGVAYRMTSNREDALDITQDALFKAYQKIGSWQPTGSFLPWLLRLTTNQSIDWLRRKRRRRHESLDDIGLHDQVRMAAESMAGGLERDVRAHEIDAHVQKALDALSPSQRTVFVLRHYEGLSLAEIAPVLGCTVGSVKVHLFRALKKLQKELRYLREEEEKK